MPSHDVTEGGLLTPGEAEWLPTVYAQGFETVFGSWMGRYSNPFAYVVYVVFLEY